MWALAFAIYCGLKWLTWRRSSVHSASFWRHAGYLVAWPGLNADAFLTRHPVPVRPSRQEWLFGWCKLGLGAWLLFAVARRVPPEHPYLTGWVGMVAIVMVLHFGSFHLLSCAWRKLGVEARPLMNWPPVSASLSEFWGRRWNTAFRDLTHRFLFRPLTRRLGARTAVLAGFAFSGLVHDVVISLPAGGGYGGPTVFFLVQGAGLLTERSGVGRSFGFGKGFRGWLFTMTLLVAPAGLLFHRPFVTEVVVPFLHAVKAI
jgi:alginate O-acetyltransferase complex protein AlgI